MAEIGKDKLWLWFGLSYAGWLTLPRVLMHEMPDEWQSKMADLLSEWDEAYPNQPDLQTQVLCKKNGKYIKTPHYLTNYRHPDYLEIEKMKRVKWTQVKNT